MKMTEMVTHAAARKAFETILDNLIKKGQTQDAAGRGISKKRWTPWT